MSSLLEQFQDDNALLLMYLANELEPEDRAEVDRRLSRDGGLRAELDRLTAVHLAVMNGLDRLEASTPQAIDEDVAVRRVGVMMRQWQFKRTAAEAAPAAAAGWRLPHWAFPAAAAAVVLVSVGLIWNSGSPNKPQVSVIPPFPTPHEDRLVQDAAASLLGSSGAVSDGADAGSPELAMSDSTDPDVADAILSLTGGSTPDRSSPVFDSLLLIDDVER